MRPDLPPIWDERARIERAERDFGSWAKAEDLRKFGQIQWKYPGDLGRMLEGMDFREWLAQALHNCEYMIAHGLVSQGINLAAVIETEWEFSCVRWDFEVIYRATYRKGAI